MEQKVDWRPAEGRPVKGVDFSRSTASGEAVSFSLLMEDGSREQFSIRLDRLGRMIGALQAAGARAQAERRARGGGADPIELIEPVPTVGQPDIGHSVGGAHRLALRFVDKQGTPIVLSIPHGEVETLAHRLLAAASEPQPRQPPKH